MSEQSSLQQAIAAARAGRKAEARQLLKQILQANPRHEQAWLWMGAVIETDGERVRCLQQALAINPDNAAARKGLAQLQARAATPQTAASPPMTPCPHCGAMNRAGARFCSGCGQDFGVAVPPSPPPSPPPQKASPRPEARSKQKPVQSRRGLWIAGVVVLGLLALGICGVGGWLVYRRMATPAGEPTAVAIGDLTPTSSSVPLPENTPEPTPAGAAANGYLLFATGNIDNWDIYISDTNGENRKLLGHNTNDFPIGGFSPNGQWLFFTKDSENSGSETTLYVADADGSGLHSVLTAPKGYVGDIAFSNDGWVMSFEVDQYRNEEHFQNSYIYNRRTDRLIDLRDHKLGQLSADGRWALLKGLERTSDGWYEYTGSFSLLDTETELWQELGELSGYARLAPDQLHVVMVDLDHQHRIYDIAQGQWAEMNLGLYSRFDFFPDGIHMLMAEEDTFYLVDTKTGEQSPYLSGYSGFWIVEWWNFMFANRTQQLHNRIVINVSKEEKKDVYLANADGTDLRLIAEDARGVPIGDEEHVLLWKSDAAEGTLFHILDLRSGIQHQVPSSAFFDFSPNGTTVLVHEFSDESFAFWNGIRLWVLDMQDMQLRSLGPTEPGLNLGAFSSDGNKIVYGVMQLDFENEHISSGNLYVADIDGSHSQLIAENAVPLCNVFGRRHWGD